MSYQATSGDSVEELIHICDCNLTGGCIKCNPFLRYIMIFPFWMGGEL